MITSEIYAEWKMYRYKRNWPRTALDSWSYIKQKMKREVMYRLGAWQYTANAINENEDFIVNDIAFTVRYGYDDISFRENYTFHNQFNQFKHQKPLSTNKSEFSISSDEVVHLDNKIIYIFENYKRLNRGSTESYLLAVDSIKSEVQHIRDVISGFESYIYVEVIFEDDRFEPEIESFLESDTIAIKQFIEDTIYYALQSK